MAAAEGELAAVSESAVSEIRSHADRADPYDYSPDELAPVQLAAANELLAQRRTEIKVLAQRADAERVQGFDNLSDLLPILFSHTTYKSYPESFLAAGNWPMMTRWLDTLNTVPAAGELDFDGISGVDDWVARLHATGHFVGTSSGTTGPPSFFDHTPADRAFRIAWLRSTAKWTIGHAIEAWPVFGLGPRGNTTSSGDWQRMRVEAFGRPDSTYFLTDEPITVAELNEQSVLRRQLADGTASPSRLAALRADATSRAEKAGGDLDRLVDNLLNHRHEPVVVSSLYVQLYDVMETARARGIGHGELLHPGSFIYTGGGTKRVGLPVDFKDRMVEYYALRPGNFGRGYGMYELSTPFPMCVAGRYHVPPWIIPIVLDQAGEQVLSPTSGRCTGRGAFFDIALESRWGGVISGDRITIDYSRCACGRCSPAVLDEISRYTDLPGDDKLSCAGTIDDYIYGLGGADL